MKRDERLEQQVTLNEEDAEKIKEWFSEHAKGETKCPVCRQRNWHTHHQIYTPVIFNLAENTHVSTMLQPTVIVECNVCGNQMYFSASKIGVNVRKYYKNGGA